MVNGKKLLASILVGAMVITGSPVAPVATVAAATEAVEGKTVKIGNAYFKTIAEAMGSNEANSGTITLTADITEDIALSKTIKVDLNEHTLKGNVTSNGHHILFVGHAGIVDGVIDTLVDYTGETILPIPEKPAEGGKPAVPATPGSGICIKPVKNDKKETVSHVVAEHVERTSILWEAKDNNDDGKIDEYEAYSVTQCRNCTTTNAGKKPISMEEATNTTNKLTESYKVTTKPTCEEDGKTEYVARMGNVVERKTITKDKTGHKYTVSDDAGWTAKVVSGSQVPVVKATYICPNEGCEDPTVEVKADVVNKVYDAPTCREKGEVTYEATAKGPDGKIKKHIGTVDVPIKYANHVLEPTNHTKDKNGTDTKKTNYDYVWKLDEKAAGHITCDVIITNCAECGAKVGTKDDPIVYTSFTVDADEKSTPAHKKDNSKGTPVCNGTLETYSLVKNRTFTFADINDEYRTANATTKIPTNIKVDENAKMPVEFTYNNVDKASATKVTAEFTVDRPLHDISSVTDQQTAACDKAGYVIGTCTVCGDTKAKNTVAKTEHVYNKDNFTTVPASCEKEGKRVYTCTECKQPVEEVLPKVDHTYVATAGKTVKNVGEKRVPLEKTDITDIRCSVCKKYFGDLYDVEISKLTRKPGHDDGHGTAKVKYVVPAELNTVTNTDIEVESENEVYTHNYKDTWKWDMTSYKDPYATVSLECKDCKLGSTIIEAYKIKFDVVTVEPTCTEKGYKDVTATATDAEGTVYTDTVRLDAPETMNGHTFDDPDVEGGNTYNKSKLVSGDYENKQIKLTCKKCNETVVADASLDVDEKTGLQTLTATIDSKVFVVSRVAIKISNAIEKEAWGSANKVEEGIPYFTYGVDPTNVLLYSAEAKLEKGVDYTIEIDSKNAGVANITVKGIGKYYGTKEYPVVIGKKAVTITLADTTITKGAALPASCVKVSGVVAGDDLKVKPVANGSVLTATYEENANYDVTVKDAKLTVVAPAPKAQSITTKKLSASYKVATVKKAAKTFSIGATCTSKKAVTAKKVSGSKKITVSSTGKVKIAKGTKKGTYTAKVKLTAPKTSSYKAATKTVKVTVKVK